MTYRIFAAALLLSAAAAAEDAPKFEDLFNGRDLSGWVDVNTSPATWSVKDGLLICTGLPIGVMRSEKQYENFILHIKWRHMKEGGTIKLSINGKFVNGMRESSVRHGYLCLEAEGSEIHFRNIRILELPGGNATPGQTAPVIK